MPVEIDFWKIGDRLERVSPSRIESETKLEDLIMGDPSIIAPDLLLIGRQVRTDHGKLIDILAMDCDGGLVVMELKRDRTPRDVVAQALDYASWVQSLERERLSDIFREKNDADLEAEFENVFETPLPEVNTRHEILIVASALDPTSERIVRYLSTNYGVPINAVFFRHFSDGGRNYLARTWLVDPHQAEAQAGRAPSRKGQEPWNGKDFYVAFGEGRHRTWEDARRYGFVSGGQGKRYSRPLKHLFPGARVFAYIPQSGYVGVGHVTDPVVPVRDFKVEVDGREVPILDAPIAADRMDENASDPDLCEHLVRVEWEKVVPIEKAHRQKGLFANQNVACHMRSRFTIAKLTEHFGVRD